MSCAAPTSGDPAHCGSPAWSSKHLTAWLLSWTGAVRAGVAYTGECSAPERLSRVLDNFYRADGARSRNPARVGLGLAIVRSIALARRGSAEIVSAPGRGTTVSLLFLG